MYVSKTMTLLTIKRTESTLKKPPSCCQCLASSSKTETTNQTTTNGYSTTAVTPTKQLMLQQLTELWVKQQQFLVETLHCNNIL